MRLVIAEPDAFGAITILWPVHDLRFPFVFCRSQSLFFVRHATIRRTESGEGISAFQHFGISAFQEYNEARQETKEKSKGRI
jgi:hypothetical protein